MVEPMLKDDGAPSPGRHRGRVSCTVWVSGIKEARLTTGKVDTVTIIEVKQNLGG